MARLRGLQHGEESTQGIALLPQQAHLMLRSLVSRSAGHAQAAGGGELELPGAPLLLQQIHHLGWLHRQAQQPLIRCHRWWLQFGGLDGVQLDGGAAKILQLSLLGCHRLAIQPHQVEQQLALLALVTPAEAFRGQWTAQQQLLA